MKYHTLIILLFLSVSTFLALTEGCHMVHSGSIILLFLSVTVLPAVSIDSSKATASFQPWQQRWIEDDSRLRLWEKSVRIGATFCDAFKNVRKRLLHAKRDYLFCTKDQASAAEYMRTCMTFVEMYGRVKSAIRLDDEFMKVPRLNAEGKDTGFTDEVRFCYIKFDNGSRIIAFSSNPNAMLVYGGDVGIDEYAAHDRAEQLWETGQGRITMGFDLGMWSAHKGMDTKFNEFAQMARSGKGGWSYHRTSMEDAINEGYLDMIEKISGRRWTREEFLQDCRDRSVLEDIYQQAYLCNPRGSTGGAVNWSDVCNCATAYEEYERTHLENKQVQELFGPFNKASEVRREAKINAWMDGQFAGAAARTCRNALGFDVAASQQGDLASIWVDEAIATKGTMRALLTFRTDDWHVLETCAAWFMDRLPAIAGRGDETGLGRHICWNLAKRFPGRFEGVNFAGEKHDMGTHLVGQISSAEKIWPEKEKDITQDYFAMRKSFRGGRLVFSESKNPLNSASHCDIAWSGALASRAASQQTGPVAYKAIKTGSSLGWGDFDQDDETSLWLPN